MYPYLCYIYLASARAMLPCADNAYCVARFVVIVHVGQQQHQYHAIFIPQLSRLASVDSPA